MLGNSDNQPHMYMDVKNATEKKNRHEEEEEEQQGRRIGGGRHFGMCPRMKQ